MKLQNMVGWRAAILLTGWIGWAGSAFGADWDVRAVHTAVPNVYPSAPNLLGGTNGVVQLAYTLQGASSNGLFFAENTSGGDWTTERAFADPVGSLASLLDVALDASGNPHIVSFDYGSPRHSVRSNGLWQTESIPNPTGSGIAPGRSAFNLAAGLRFVFWDGNSGRLVMRWKNAFGWQIASNLVMAAAPESFGRISGLMDLEDAGSEIHVLYHDGQFPGSLRIATWSESQSPGSWVSDSEVAANVDASAPFSATLVRSFGVRYIYVAFGRREGVFRNVTVTRRALSAIPNTWTEVDLVNVYGLDNRKITIRSGSGRVAIAYLGFNSVQLVQGDLAETYEAIGDKTTEDVPALGDASEYDMTIANGSVWVAVASANQRTLSVSRLGLGGGQQPASLALLPATNNVFAGIRPAGLVSGTLSNGVRLSFPATVIPGPVSDWNGATLEAEVVENPDGQDLVGLVDSPTVRISGDGSMVEVSGVPIATFSRLSNQTISVTLNAQATTASLAQLVNVLGYGWSGDLGALTRSAPTHVETNRVIRIRLAAVAGDTAEQYCRVEMPRVVGLELEGLGTDGLAIQTTGLLDPFEPISLALELRLSDGTRLSLPDRSGIPFGADAWTTSGAAAVGVTVSTDRPAAAFSAQSFPAIAGVQVEYGQWQKSGRLVWIRSGDLPADLTSFLRLILYVYQKYVASGEAGPSLAIGSAGSRRQTALSPAAGGADSLAAPYALFTWLLLSSEGQRLAGLYYSHSAEATQILRTNSTLLREAAGVVGEFLPGLSGFLAGKGDDWVIRPDMVDRLNTVWDLLADSGGPEFKAALNAERDRFHGFEDFSGRTFGEWGRTLAIGVPETPIIVLSSPQHSNSVTSAEANRVEGVSYTLQKSPPSEPLAWTDVSNAIIQLFDFRVEVADTNAFGAGLLYRLKTTEAKTDQ